jgi:long-chain acyl-CoA synthetase
MEEETAKALKNGWFHTGDLGFLDEDDYLTITGRIKNLIILSNGENISAEELEAKLYYCKAIAEVVVYEKEDKIAAMIYLDKDFITTNKIADGQEYVRNFVNEYNKTASTTKKINELSFRDEPFEKTATQKIKRILN